MQLLEGSDAQIKFRITDEDGELVNYSDYSKFLLEAKFINGIQEFEGTIDDEFVIFDIMSEDTNHKAGVVNMDIRGIKDDKKIRFNETTILGVILNSVKVPEGELN